ncbi:MAG: hypothetical protein J5685_09365 [Clostridiales bacterium]|nr:hypothetical protein [Clostridiales bacterium]
MSDDRPHEVFVEGTQFYRKNGAADILRIVVITAVVMVCISVFALWAVLDSGARRAYKEARDIRRALPIIATEYYGGKDSIFDPGNHNGLAAGASEKIAEISTRDGEVILYSWDEENNAPVQFEYRRGLYRVLYTDYGLRDDASPGTVGEFKVYYSFELLDFEAE